MAGHIRKRGNKWYYSFEIAEVEGKRKRIERVGGTTKKEAERALRKALEEYENAGLHFEPSQISLADYMDYWFKNYVEINCRHNTQLAYMNIIKNHIKPSLGFYRLNSLTPVVLQDFINNKYIQGFSKSYLESIINLLNNSLKFAVYPGNFIKNNPMQYIIFPKFKQAQKSLKEKIISIEDFERIIDRFPIGSTYYIPLVIGFYTGLRIGEVAGLTWEDIDLGKKTLDVNKILYKKNKAWYFGQTKTESSNRIIKFGNNLTQILKSYKRLQAENKLRYGPYYTLQYLEEINEGADQLKRIHSKLVEDKSHHKQINILCTKENGEMFTPDSFRYGSRIINYELNIDFNFHSLRHTHATILLENNANIKDIQKRLGHSKISTTMDIYSHATEKIENQTVEIFDSLVGLPTI